MDLNFNSKLEEYYQRFIELQDKLKRSEEQRFMLEMKFNEMAKISKEEEQAYYRKLRAQYKRFLEEDYKRQERNERIIRNLERIEMKISMLSAKTDRINMFRRQYQNYLRRIANSDNTGKTPILRPSRERSFIKEEPLREQQHASFRDDYSLPERPKEIFDKEKPMFEHPAVKKALEKDRSNEEKIEILDRYLQSISSQRCQDILKEERQARENLASDLASERFFKDDFTSRATNNATAAADDIMKSIYSRYYTKADVLPNDTKIDLLKNSQNDNKESYNMEKLDYTVDTKKFDENTYLNPVLRQNSENFKQKIPDVKFEQEFNVLGNHSSDIYKKNEDGNNETLTKPAYADPDSHSREYPVEETILPRNTEYKENITTSITKEEIEKNNEETKMKTTPQNHELLQNTESFEAVCPSVENKKIQQIDSFEVKQISYNMPVDDKINEDILSDMKPNDNRNMVAFDPNLQAEVSNMSNDSSETQNEDASRNKADLQQSEIQSNQHLIDSQNKDIGKSEKIFSDQELDQDKQQNKENHVILNQQNKDVDLTPQHYESIDQTKNQSDLDNQESVGHLANNKITDSDHHQSSMHIDNNEQSAQLHGSGEAQHHHQNDQFYSENQQDENGKIIQPQQEQYYNENPEQPSQYDETGQHIDYAHNDPSYQHIQYDENGQPIQYDQNNQPVPYDENGQPTQYDGNNQPIAYDENGQPTQYDENSQPMGYDQYGQPLLYDQNGQIVQPQYDENGQIVPQYDENGQVIILYDQNGQQVVPGQQQYDSNGQPIVQYDENGQPIYDQSQQQYYDYNNQEQSEQSQLYNQYQADDQGQYVEPEVQQIQDSIEHHELQEQPEEITHEDVYQDADRNKEHDPLENVVKPQIDEIENQVGYEEKSNEEINPGIAETIENTEQEVKVVNEEHDADKNIGEKTANVMDILDTDTESTRQDTNKISNGSDFDFS